MTEEPRRTARRVLLLCGVLAATTLTGYAVRHSRPVPDAAARVDWQTVCRGHGGPELHRLLGGGTTAVVNWSGFSGTAGAEQHLSQSCEAELPHASAIVSVTDIDTQVYSRRLKALAHPAPGLLRFAAGDAAAIRTVYADSPADAWALTTCRLPGKPVFHALITLTVSSTPRREPDGRRRMEDLVRAWAKDMQNEKHCGTPL